VAQPIILSYPLPMSMLSPGGIDRNSRELMFVDPVHKLPRTLFLVSNFLNLEVKEFSFCALDSFLE